MEFENKVKLTQKPRAVRGVQTYRYSNTGVGCYALNSYIITWLEAPNYMRLRLI